VIAQGTRLLVALRLVANCYIPFTFTFTLTYHKRNDSNRIKLVHRANQRVWDISVAGRVDDELLSKS